MNILIEHLINEEGISRFIKLQEILQGGKLFENSYYFDDSNKRCVFELERYFIEKPIKETRFLFFKSYRLGTVRSVLEICPILEIKETKEGYEDLEIGINKERNVLTIGTYRHSFNISVTDKTKVKVYDNGNLETKTRGYFSKKYWVKLKEKIDYLVSAEVKEQFR